MLKLENHKYPFVHKQAVIWTDIDALGHVNHARYITYFENARTSFFANNGLVITAGQQAPETGPVIADLQFTFRGQVHFPATLDVTLGVSKISSRSFEMVCTIWNDDLHVASAQASFLWIHLQQGRPVRLPEKLATILENIKTK